MSNIQSRIIKTQLNQETEELREETAKALINSSEIICLFGVSIGETDQLWWKVIYDWLKPNSQRQLIIFYYVKNYDKSDTDKNNRDKNSIRNKFYLLAEVKDDQKNKINNKIHIAYSEKMFKIDFSTPE